MSGGLDDADEVLEEVLLGSIGAPPPLQFSVSSCCGRSNGAATIAIAFAAR